MRLVALFVGVVILYGSLHPFAFSSWPGWDAALHTLATSIVIGRGDVVANLLLYAPLGLFVVLAVRTRLSPAVAVSLAIGLGLTLSVGVELAQTALPMRDTNLIDVAANGVGTSIGALAALLPIRALRAERRPGALPDLPAGALFALLLCTAWFGWQLAPFVPTIDLQEYKDSLKPLLAEAPRAPGVLRFACAWLTVGLALRVATGRRHLGLLLAAAMAGVMVGRVMVDGATLNWSLLLGSAAALAVWVTPLHRLAVRPWVLAAGLALAIASLGLDDLGGAPQQAFSWVPFSGFLHGSMLVDVQVMLGKVFLYGSLVFLLRRGGLGTAGAGVLTAAFLAVIEVAQVSGRGHVPEITDPLIALILAALAAVFDRVEDGARTNAGLTPGRGARG